MKISFLAVLRWSLFFLKMLWDVVFRFKDFGDVSKVKSMFSLLVSTGNHCGELTCKEPDEILQNLIWFEITLFIFFHEFPFKYSISSFNSAMTSSLFCLCREVSWQDSLNWISIIVFSSFHKSPRTSFLTCFNFAFSFNLFKYVNKPSLTLSISGSESVSISMFDCMFDSLSTTTDIIYHSYTYMARV